MNIGLQMDKERFIRIVNREKAARKESERLLEVKSSELYQNNKNLERLVSERTIKLSKALKYAEEAAEIKDAFLSNMSHEIRTPLSAILGFVEIMMNSPYNEETFFKHLGIVHNSSKNLLQIIDDILDFSKLQSGKFTLSPIDVNLKEKIEHIFSLFSKAAEEKSLSYGIFFSDHFPDCFITDETRVIQILSNFISNAIKFTPVGNMVTVNVNYDPAGKMLEAEVQDTGIGISEEAKNNIFNSFEQEDTSVTREYGGTGLGLVIAKQLIEVLNGEIIFKSAKGKGSTFGFKIPVVTCEKSMPDDIKNEHQQGNYKGRVLIAEDDEMCAMLMEALMEGFGIQFDIVSNGELAIEALKNKEYALVFMDNQMPKVSGKEATRQIREFNLNIPIVALSANALKNEQQAFLDAGMNDTLSKPIDHKELEIILHKYLANSKTNKKTKL